jgi:hypothetical protein
MPNLASCHQLAGRREAARIRMASSLVGDIESWSD